MTSTLTPRGTCSSPILGGQVRAPNLTDQTGAVYLYSRDGMLRKVMDSGLFPNGIAVSADDTTLAAAISEAVGSGTALSRTVPPWAARNAQRILRIRPSVRLRPGPSCPAMADPTAFITTSRAICG